MQSEQLTVFCFLSRIYSDDALEEDDSPKSEVASVEHLHRLYIFAFAWSLGAFLSSADCNRMDAYMKKRFKTYDFPKDEEGDSTIFDFYVSTSGQWEHWRNLVSVYVYPENTTPEYSSILIPIIDNARIEYLVSTIANQERAVLLIGEQVNLNDDFYRKNRIIFLP